MISERICVLGLGYIGLPTAALFATHGYEVVGVDINPAIVQSLARGETHNQEPGLRTLVQAAVKSGQLKAKLAPEEADVFIIAVPTPATPDKRADLRAVVSATELIVPYLRKGNMVVLESTVPPATVIDVVVPILERSGLKAGEDVDVVHAPERVLPGGILVELVQNDRIIGGIDRKSAARARDLYRSFVNGDIYLTNATTAELVKLMENTFRDVNIALANSFARIGDRLGLNSWEAIELANRHPRVSILQPGPGVGGHCIAVDPWFIVQAASEESQLIATARVVNDEMPSYVTRAILDELIGVTEPVIAMLGAAYKARAEDTRESPALQIAEQLTEHCVQVKIHDPYVFPEKDLLSTVEGADCLALIVKHPEYSDLDPWALGKQMRRKVVYDAQNLLPSEVWQAAGFRVKRLGDGFSSNGTWGAHWLSRVELGVAQER